MSSKVYKSLLKEIEENAPYVRYLKKLLKNKKDQVTPEMRFELSTLRNKNLITKKEQQKLKKTVVGFFGLSVGSHAVSTWTMLSRADVVKIIDPDTIDPSNLNRIRTGWDSVGENKTIVVKNEIKCINPDMMVITSTKTDSESIFEIFNNDPAVDFVVDEVDDLEAKIVFRKFARKNRLPLISAIDVGDNVILDIERYDIDPQPKMFLGRIPKVEKLNLNELSFEQKVKLIVNLVGAENFSKRLEKSMKEIGVTLKTWPQLGATATIAGGAIATSIKKIVLGEKVKSGRYIISLDKILSKN